MLKIQIDLNFFFLNKPLSQRNDANPVTNSYHHSLYNFLYHLWKNYNHYQMDFDISKIRKKKINVKIKIKFTFTIFIQQQQQQ